MASYPTVHEVQTAASEYWEAWEQLLSRAEGLRPTIGQHSATAIGWKVEGDIAPLEAVMRLFELGDSAYIGPVAHERSIMTIRKASPIALDTLVEIEIIQRRPSRVDDRLGADCLVLFLPHGVPSVDAITKSLGESGAEATEEHNESHRWISIKEGGHEFKLTDRAIWEVCAREAAELAGLSVTPS